MSEKGISESSPSGDSQNEEANWGRRELLIVVIQVLLVSAISGGIGGCSAVLEEIPQAPIGELIDAFAIGLTSSMLSAACLIILSVALLWGGMSCPTPRQAARFSVAILPQTRCEVHFTFLHS